MSRVGEGGNTYTGAVTVNQINIPSGGITSAEVLNGSLKVADMDFVAVGKNKFNIALSISGKYIDNTTGTCLTTHPIL